LIYKYNYLSKGPLGEQLDNMMGGNPNPTYGQVVGGAPGVGGFNNMNQGMGGQYPGQQFPGAGGFNNMNQGMGGQFSGQGHHHHH
jgi:hypothetical protein